MKTDFVAIAELGRAVAPIRERLNSMTFEEVCQALAGVIRETSEAFRKYQKVYIVELLLDISKPRTKWKAFWYKIKHAKRLRDFNNWRDSVLSEDE